MVQFGKRMLEKQYEPWKEYYIHYKRLKKLLNKGVKQKQQTLADSNSSPLPPPPTIAADVVDDGKNNTFPFTLTAVPAAAPAAAPTAENKPTSIITTDSRNYETSTRSADRQEEIIYYGLQFRKALDYEIEHVVLFFLQKQGDLASQLSSLSEQKQSLIDLDLDATKSLLTKYENIGEDLLHLIHFVDLNVTAVRKILKKHDKIYTNYKISNAYLSRSIINIIQSSSNTANNNNDEHYYDSHLNQLYHYGGISALVTSLKLALYELSNHEKFLLSQKYSLQSFPSSFPSLHDATPHHMTSWSNWSPVSLVTKRHSSYGSISNFDNYNAATMPENSDNNTSIHQYHPHRVETILLRIDMARNHLYQSKDYVDILASQLLMLEGSEDDDDDVNMTESMREEQDVRKEAAVKSTNQQISSWLNLLSTFLYMTNYYIIAPTCGPYAEALGSSSALGGIIIGMTPLAALMASVLYAWWSNYSYKSALLFASCCCILGDLLYALALHYKSLNMIIIGRYLNGFGSARAINRRYIADTFSRRERTAASAAFVTSGALGMAFGPATAAVLAQLKYNGDIWTNKTSPGWVMLVLWTVYFICVIFYFDDPDETKARAIMRAEQKYKINTNNDILDMEDSNKNKENNALLSIESHQNDEKDIKKKKAPLFKNVPVMTTLWNYFVIKLVLECLLSSSSMLTSSLFHWNMTNSGCLLAMLGLLMFPANLLVAKMSLQYEEREMIKFTLLLMLFGLVGVLTYGNEDYTIMQYVFFCVCIFVGTNALEGPNMSLLSKTIPSEWAKSTFNAGLLSTEAGTFGRVVGDVLVSFAGFIIGDHSLLNGIFIPNMILVVFTLMLNVLFFSSLEPKDEYDDDDDNDTASEKSFDN